MSMNWMKHVILGAVAVGVAGSAWAQGPIAPLNAGEKLVYAFTGVVNDTSPSDETATIISCTNVGKDPVDVTVEIYTSSGSLSDTDTQNLFSGETETWETQNTAHIAGSAVAMSVGGIFDAGSGRITAIGKKVLLLCVAQAIDASGSVAGHIANLPVVPIGKLPKVKPLKN